MCDANMMEYIERERNYPGLAKTLRESPPNRRLMWTAADAIEELTGLLQEAERDRDEYRERMETAFSLMPRWISVTERLPEQGGKVLICYGDRKRITVSRYISAACDDVRWWMPLPTPPKEERLFDSLKRGLEQAINGECRSVTLTTPVMEYPQVPGITPTLIAPKEDEA